MADYDDPFGDPFASPVAPVSQSNVRQAQEDGKFKALVDKILYFAPPDDEGFISGKALRPVLLKAEISMPQLKEVWSLADKDNRGSLTKDELKILLSLIAQVQLGRSPSLDAIKSNKETLVPNIQNVDEIVAMAPTAAAPVSNSPFSGTPAATATPPPAFAASSSSSNRNSTAQTGNTQLHFQSMIDRESVEIKISSRVGTKLLSAVKTVYFDVASKLFRATVTRRYSDFDWLHDTLLKHYPYRLVPPIPPKQMIVGLESEAYIEDRRKGLQRFMEYLGRHPIFSLDEDVKVFYTEPDEERFNDYKKSRTPMVVSEFYNHPKASTAKDCLPAGAAETLHMVRDKLPALSANINKLVESSEASWKRVEGEAYDYSKFGLAFEAIVESDFPVQWVSSNRNYKVLTSKFESLSKLFAEEAGKVIDSTVEKLKHQQGITTAFQDLFIRSTQLTQKDAQTLIKRIQSNKSKLTSLTAKGTVGKAVDVVIQQIEQDEKEIELLGKLDDFVTLCMWEELAFFKLHKAFITLIIRDFVKGRFQYGDKILDNWRQMEPYVMDLPTTGF